MEAKGPPTLLFHGGESFWAGGGGGGGRRDDSKATILISSHAKCEVIVFVFTTLLVHHISSVQNGLEGLEVFV